MACVSLVPSLMECCATVWDPYLQKDIDKLQGIQRRGARFIKRDNSSEEPRCATTMLSELDMKPLQERRKQQRLFFLCMVVTGQFPATHTGRGLRTSPLSGTTKRPVTPRTIREPQEPEHRSADGKKQLALL